MIHASFYCQGVDDTHSLECGSRDYCIVRVGSVSGSPCCNWKPLRYFQPHMFTAEAIQQKLAQGRPVTFGVTIPEIPYDELLRDMRGRNENENENEKEQAAAAKIAATRKENEQLKKRIVVLEGVLAGSVAALADCLDLLDISGNCR